MVGEVWKRICYRKAAEIAFGFAVFSMDRKRLAISAGQELQIVDASTGATAGCAIFISNDLGEGRRLALAASFNPKGDILGVAVCGPFVEIGELVLYKGSDLQKVAGFQPDTVLTSLAFTPDGSLLFAGGYDGTVRVMESQRGSLVATLFHGEAHGSSSLPMACTTHPPMERAF
jgi:WD40 repeat protein